MISSLVFLSFDRTENPIHTHIFVLRCYMRLI
uniref:Uncharacterized protein n=1 Tax=Arundo donax TaxID=35708 RepID=A0A0A8ZWL3_ARUDO